jgi:hypothetical protein
MIWLLPTPSPLSPVSELDRRHTGRLRKRDNLLTGVGEGGGGEANSYAKEENRKWSSINHSILPGQSYTSEVVILKSAVQSSFLIKRFEEIYKTT